MLFYLGNLLNKLFVYLTEGPFSFSYSQNYLDDQIILVFDIIIICITQLYI